MALIDEKRGTGMLGERSALMRRAEQVASHWRTGLAAWVPLFLTPFVPGSDLPLNTACAELLGDALRGLAPAATYH